MLGTGGGPRPRPDRAATSHALIVDDVLYALDCGHPVAPPPASRRWRSRTSCPRTIRQSPSRRWLDAARPHVGGEIVVARDLMQL